MKSHIFWILIIFFSGKIYAQNNFNYVDGLLLNLRGSCLATAEDYNRIDSLNRINLPPRVQELSQNSAGLNVNFETNATSIKINWELSKVGDLWNMTPVAVNGLDLYALNKGKWQYVASARPDSVKNSILMVRNLDGKPRKYKLYLPLYAKLNKLEVGVPDTSYIRPSDGNFTSQRKIVIYGSSITQGASASRPGMAYPSIISRKLGIETINLGFSGSGKMEIEMARILAQLPADVYVLDCVPNPSPEQIKERSLPFIQHLRKQKPNVPIIMVESIYRETAGWDFKVKTMVEQQNAEFKRTYKTLHKENPKNLYYIPSENLIGTDHEATVDGTHLTDLGFMRLSEVILKYLKKAL